MATATADHSVAASTSSDYSPFNSPRHPLPIMALRSKIVEKVRENRVTFVVGDTGCGKSSQVPQFLLEEGMEPILCTQPRRFAVVAIARMLARARNCELGGEVGYHIGHANVSDKSSNRSRLVFKTAGVLLEQIRDKGASALKYQVIILDEVHERSVESDLVLASVKQFMLRGNDLRLVLMSATAEIARYRDYFRDLGRSERVEVIAIPTATQQSIFQRKVLYLEQCMAKYSYLSIKHEHALLKQLGSRQVAQLLGIGSDSLAARCCSGLNPSSADADMKPEVHSLIHKLVLHIHESEPDMEKSILIFLPTYYALEQQWILLNPLSMFFKVHILHRSIDTDQALLAMRICKSHRKVILATNIAESSVTIPGVAFVIDSCRSLQVFWDSNRKKESTELVWVSKSQADQRKGRTGRTCDGHIYRLITGSFYNQLNDHEYPAILRLSLRQQVLMLCCAESRAINDPKVLLRKVLDPPNSEVVDDALSLLVHIHALEKPSTPRGRYEPTYYGRLLDSLPLTFDASVIALKFAEIGILQEGILVSIFLDIQPLPILQPFGEQVLFTEYLDKYFDGEVVHTSRLGKKETVIMGNLCAFQFWQRVCKDKHRLECLQHIIKVGDVEASHAQFLKLEEEWCSFHNLVQTSLHHVAEIYEDILHAMHRYRPGFFKTKGLPSYYEPYAYNHTCLLEPELKGSLDDLSIEDDNHDSFNERRRCISVPFVASNDFQATTVAVALQEAIKEMRVQHTEAIPWNQGEPANNIIPYVADATLCKFFINGHCNRGSQCSFSHSFQAKRPTCKFFLTFQGCHNGDSCYFSHEYVPRISSNTSQSVCSPENEIASAHSFLRLLPEAADGHVLVFGDKDFTFSSKLSKHYDPSKIFATTPFPYSAEYDTLSSGITKLCNICHSCRSIIEPQEKVPIPWANVRAVLVFASTEANGGEIQCSFLQNFFEFLAIRILADTLYNVRVIVTMNNVRFAHLQVERLARDCFFFLSQSSPFDEATFGHLLETSGGARPMQVSLPISYVFDMHPPTDIQFGDYATVFRKALYSNS